MKRRELLKLIGITPLLGIQPLGEPVNAGYATISADVPFHLMIYGATPGGVTCAIRAAREGLKVLLINPTEHLGGMFANGLGIMDTLYNGARAPLYDEFRQSIYDFYRLKYGKDSAQYESAGPGISKTKYEAHVAEQLINEWLVAEPGIKIIKGFYPATAHTVNGQIKQVVFGEVSGEKTMEVQAVVFADCSYEGDLLAVAGAPYRTGREAKEEYNEKYAGIVYSKDIEPDKASEASDKDQAPLIRNLNLFRYKESRTMLMPGSTGVADPAIQAFNFRAVLTDDPNNRFLPDRPASYDAAYFSTNYKHKPDALTLSRPNRKSSLPYPEIMGLQNKYVEGNWTERKNIIQRYKNELNGLFYFRQNDPSLAPEIREHWRKYGFAKDEFADNNHIPYELYVREARRTKGKAVFTEHDAQLAPGLQRAPIHSDSIGVTEWFLDSHACTGNSAGDSKNEGEVMLKSETVPGQIPLGVILPLQPGNLIVPVCVSASHIGLGAIRLEPVWMSLGEVAGYIAAEICIRGITTSDIDADKLSRKLVLNRIMISFFNDVEGREYTPWYPAIQYLGTKGFFGSYEARPQQKLTRAMAGRWAAHVGTWKEKADWHAATEVMKTVKTEAAGAESLKAAEFAGMIEQSLHTSHSAAGWLATLNIHGETMITRGDAARVIFEATGKSADMKTA